MTDKDQYQSKSRDELEQEARARGLTVDADSTDKQIADQLKQDDSDKEKSGV